MPLGDRDCVRGAHPPACTCASCTSQRLARFRRHQRFRRGLYRPILAVGVVGLIGLGVLGLYYWSLRTDSAEGNAKPARVVETNNSTSGKDIQPSGTKEAPSHWLEDISMLEAAVHERINTYRGGHGLGALIYSSDIANIAQRHSERMASAYQVRGILLHSDELSPSDPFENSSFGCGENILMTPRVSAVTKLYGIVVSRDDDILEMAPGELASRLVQQWIESPLHEENMGGREYEFSGLGIYYDKKSEQLFATHNLCFNK